MIAIPNMEKPKSCQECPAHTFDYGYIPDYDGCRILKRAFNIDKLDINPFDEVLSDCPLIEIGNIEYRAYKEVEAMLLQKIEERILYGERRADEY